MAINKLVEIKLISTKRMGVPCKTYYKINENEILRLCENTKAIFQKDITNQVSEKLKNKKSRILSFSYENFEELDDENLNINNNNKNNKKNNKEYNTSYKRKNYKPNYQQREYPPEFFRLNKNFQDETRTFIDPVKQLEHEERAKEWDFER